MSRLIKFSFQCMAIFWMVAPLIFCVMRVSRIFDYRGMDWAIFLGLSLVSFITMFLIYRPDAKEAD